MLKLRALLSALAVFFFVFAGRPAMALEEFEGTVCSTLQNKLGLALVLSDCTPLQFDSSAVLEDFLGLQIGDTALVQGTFSQNKIKVISVQTVGLRRLLGRWRDSAGQIFRFETVNKLRQFPLPSSFNSVVFDLEVFPDGRGKWLLIAVSGQKVFTGTLREWSTRPAAYELCLLSSDTPKSCVNLTRLWN